MSKLSQATDLRLRRFITDWRTLLFLGAMTVVGIALMVVGERTSDANHPLWRALLLAWGGLFVATATVSLFWELWGRRSFSQEVLAAAGVATDAREAGLRALNHEYLQVADWPELFHHAREIDLFASWGSTWRQAHEARWQEWSRQGNVRLRVLLPQPGDPALLKHLADRFMKTENYVRGKIEETAAFYKGLGENAGDGTTVEVRHLVRAPVWAYYRLGGTIVTTLYPASLVSAPSVPAMVFDGRGSTGQFFTKQFEACWDEAAEQGGAQ
jgi:hypothetical protein